MLHHPVSYDLQIFAHGGWRTVSVFRAREDAIRKAQLLEIGPACQAVRVLHETYDRRSGRIGHETVFRRSVLDQDRIAAARADLAVARLLGKRKEAAASTLPAAAKGKDWPLFSAFGMRMLALLIGSAAVMEVLQRIVTS